MIGGGPLQMIKHFPRQSKTSNVAKRWGSMLKGGSIDRPRGHLETPSDARFAFDHNTSSRRWMTTTHRSPLTTRRPGTSGGRGLFERHREP
jgi:hypothetical protein